MPIPDYQTVMRPLLEAVRDGTPKSLADVKDAMCTRFSLSEDERREMIPSGRQTVMHNHQPYSK